MHGARDCGESRNFNFVPSQKVLYLGTVLDSRTLVASPSSDRIARLLSLGGDFLSSVQQPTACWRFSAGHSVFSHPSCARGQASYEVSSIPTPPALDRVEDSTHLGPEVVSGLWSPGEVGVSINARELLHFQSSLRGSTVAIYVDNSTAVAYLRKSGGTRSLFLDEIAQRILRWSELHAITLAPQFIPGSRNVLADSLSRPHQSLGSEWPLHRDVFRDLRLRWPVMVDLFATSANHRCSVYFSPFRDPQAAGTDAFLQSWDEPQAYAFPPRSIIPRVLAKLRASRGTFLTLVAPYWPQRPWFSVLLDLAVAPPVVLPSCPDLFQPLSGLRHSDLLRLRLHAWRLSGDYSCGRFLLRCCFSGGARSPSFLEDELPTHVADLSILVS